MRANRTWLIIGGVTFLILCILPQVITARYAMHLFNLAGIFAILTLGLGIGVTTATFSCADALLWKPIPLPDMETLAMIGTRYGNDPDDFESSTPADVEDLRKQAVTLNGLAN